MQDTETGSIYLEKTISRAKDCNGDLIARYFEVSIDASFVVRWKKSDKASTSRWGNDNMHRQNTSPVVLIGRPVYGFFFGATHAT